MALFVFTFANEVMLYRRLFVWLSVCLLPNVKTMTDGIFIKILSHVSLDNCWRRKEEVIGGKVSFDAIPDNSHRWRLLIGLPDISYSHLFVPRRFVPICISNPDANPGNNLNPNP